MREQDGSADSPSGKSANTRINAGINALRDLWPHHDGPAHIVLADFNVRDDDLAYCIQAIDEGSTLAADPDRQWVGHPVFAATRTVLRWILDNSTAEERAVWSEDPYTALYADLEESAS